MASEVSAGLILAGGNARRMGGVDKGLSLFKDKPLIEHCIDTLSSHYSKIYISANRNKKDYSQYGYPILQDAKEFKGLGPLAGIAAAMEVSQQKTIAVLACDIVDVNISAFIKMQTQIDNHDVVYAINQNQAQYLVSIWQCHLLPEILVALNKKKLAVKDFLSQKKTYAMRFDEQLWRNINTLEDLQAS